MAQLPRLFLRLCVSPWRGPGGPEGARPATVFSITLPGISLCPQMIPSTTSRAETCRDRSRRRDDRRGRARASGPRGANASAESGGEKGRGGRGSREKAQPSSARQMFRELLGGAPLRADHRAGGDGRRENGAETVLPSCPRGAWAPGGRWPCVARLSHDGGRGDGECSEGPSLSTREASLRGASALRMKGKTLSAGGWGRPGRGQAT